VHWLVHLNGASREHRHVRRIQDKPLQANFFAEANNVGAELTLSAPNAASLTVGPDGRHPDNANASRTLIKTRRAGGAPLGR
jgi:hypothetical protein